MPILPVWGRAEVCASIHEIIKFSRGTHFCIANIGIYIFDRMSIFRSAYSVYKYTIVNRLYNFSSSSNQDIVSF